MGKEKERENTQLDLYFTMSMPAKEEKQKKRHFNSI